MTFNERLIKLSKGEKMKDRYKNLNSAYVSEYTDSNSLNTEIISFPGIDNKSLEKKRDEEPMDRFK